jgi:hypothetical protein
MTNTTATTSPNPTRTALRTLASWQDGPFVSIFLPQDPKRPDMDATHLKDVVQWALGALVSEHGQTPAQATAILAPVADAASRTGAPGHGAAWFLAPDRCLHLELPGVTAAVVEIGGAPDTLRLLTHLSTGPDYYVLAVSQKHARVFRANRFSIEPFEVADLPKSLDDALWYIQREPTFERHGSGAMHASGGGQQYHKDDIHQYLHQVDRSLCAALAGSHAPLVVMGVGYEASMYINESHYRHVLHTPVSGNPDALDLATIHQRSWAVVSSESAPAATAAARARNLAGTGRAITGIDEIVEAAQNGAVDQLVVAQSLTNGGERRGRLDADRQRLSTALVAAMAHGAAAHVVADEELPSGAVAAAVLRF